MDVLIHQIENRTYEKTLASQTNFDVALPEHIRKQAKLAVTDEYTFDFLELVDEHSERQLDEKILAKIGPFLLEMGGIFAFVGSLYRLEVDALRESSKPIGVATYRIVSSVPAELRNDLPNPDEIKRLLAE